MTPFAQILTVAPVPIKWNPWINRFDVARHRIAVERPGPFMRVITAPAQITALGTHYMARWNNDQLTLRALSVFYVRRTSMIINVRFTDDQQSHDSLTVTPERAARWLYEGASL